MPINQRQLISELCHLRRDIVSDGFDTALESICNRFPLRIHEFATGTRCWSWTIPPKWTCEAAYVETMDGKRIIDQEEHPLHVASYSNPIDSTVTREELLCHIHVHSHCNDQPPFIFYYYQDNWGFGCSQTVLDSLKDEQYRVVIKSRLEPGTLKVGELVLPGKTEDSFVISTHLCHPSQASDGLSGVATGLAVMEKLRELPERHYTYRLLIGPETIGSVAWLSQHEALIPTINGGLFLEMTGLRQPPALQMSYYGNTQADVCLRHVHMNAEKEAWCAPHRGIVGNDERQFNAPGVRIPMLSYSRALPWEHPLRPFREYHSAADTPSTIDDGALNRSAQTVVEMLSAWDANYYPVNRFKGEVFLSGINLGVDRHKNLAVHRNMLRIMDYIDGTLSIADIAEKMDIPFSEIRSFIDQLRGAHLVDIARHPTSDRSC